jgi:hypothetical protein
MASSFLTIEMSHHLQAPGQLEQVAPFTAARERPILLAPQCHIGFVAFRGPTRIGRHLRDDDI